MDGLLFGQLLGKYSDCTAGHRPNLADHLIFMLKGQEGPHEAKLELEGLDPWVPDAQAEILNTC